MAKIQIVIDADSAEEARSEMVKLLATVQVTRIVQPGDANAPFDAQTQERQRRAAKAQPKKDALEEAAPLVSALDLGQHVDTGNVFADQVAEVTKAQEATAEQNGAVTLEDVKAAGQAAVDKAGASGVKGALTSKFVGSDDRPLAQFSKAKPADYAAIIATLQAL